MAQPTTSKFSEFGVKVGDGGGPEVFTFLCGLTSKGLDINNNTATSVVPDCADEDAPAFEEVDIVSQSFMVRGSGIFTRENSLLVQEWALDGTVKNIRVYPGKSVTDDIEYFEGPAILKTLGLAVNRGERVSQNLEFAFTQKPTRSYKA